MSHVDAGICVARAGTRWVCKIAPLVIRALEGCLPVGGVRFLPCRLPVCRCLFVSVVGVSVSV